MNAPFHHNSAATTEREFLLGSMRVACRKLKSWANEIEMIGTALRGGMLSMDAACEALDDIGVLRWLPPEAADYEGGAA